MLTEDKSLTSTLLTGPDSKLAGIADALLCSPPERLQHAVQVGDRQFDVEVFALPGS
jgi:hypothetical protein